MDGLLKITNYKVLEPYKIWLQYDNGATGAVDLSDLAAKKGFTPWKDPSFFANMRVKNGRYVHLDLCPDALYIRLTSHNPYS